MPSLSVHVFLSFWLFSLSFLLFKAEDLILSEYVRNVDQASNTVVTIFNFHRYFTVFMSLAAKPGALDLYYLRGWRMAGAKFCTCTVLPRKKKKVYLQGPERLPTIQSCLFNLSPANLKPHFSRSRLMQVRQRTLWHSSGGKRLPDVERRRLVSVSTPLPYVKTPDCVFRGGGVLFHLSW